LILKGNNPREISNILGMPIEKIIAYIYPKNNNISKTDIIMTINKTIRDEFEDIIKNTLEYIKDDKIKKLKELKESKPETEKDKFTLECMIPIIKRQIEVFRDEYDYFYSEQLQFDEQTGELFRYNSSQNWFFSDVKKCYGDVKDIDKELFEYYFQLRNPQFWMGELYWNLYLIEKYYYFIISEILNFYDWKNSGNNWRKVPEKIRIKCHQRREKDSFPDEPYNYLTLIDMMNIIDKNWKDFSEFFEESFGGKKEFLDNFKKINVIRNKVMHPIKKSPILEDFIFVSKFFKTTCASLKTFNDAYNHI